MLGSETLREDRRGETGCAGADDNDIRDIARAKTIGTQA
jgi:hypothetical protein